MYVSQPRYITYLQFQEKQQIEQQKAQQVSFSSQLEFYLQQKTTYDKLPTASSTTANYRYSKTAAASSTTPAFSTTQAGSTNGSFPAAATTTTASSYQQSQQHWNATADVHALW
jgi:hypothetical protein